MITRGAFKASFLPYSDPIRITAFYGRADYRFLTRCESSGNPGSRQAITFSQDENVEEHIDMTDCLSNDVIYLLELFVGFFIFFWKKKHSLLDVFCTDSEAKQRMSCCTK